jgi:dTMP kinase
MRGKFISFEGIEGCGKSTQVRLLVGYLQAHNIPYLKTREPGGTPIAEAIRNILLDPACQEMLPETELLLYNASRCQHTGELILPALKAGKLVVCDRYYDSTYAYQGAARDLDEEIIDTLTQYATFNTVPDMTVLLDLPVEQGLARIKQRKLDRLEQEDVSFHEKVRQQFLFIAKKQASRYLVLDGSKTPEELHQEILRALKFA